MTLLKEVMERPLDPGYAAAAARRESADAVPRSTLTKAWMALLAVLLGAVTVTAAVELRKPQPAAVEARQLLDEQIAERQEEADALAAQVDAVGSEVDALRSSALEEVSPALLETLRRDGVQSGATAVSGPGAVVTLRDASTLAGAEVDPDTRVQDLDLQIVVNSLWAAGAEAIAVNDHRLTSMSAIRSAGDAVLVDLQPINSPYVIVAIGDPGDLQSGLARSDAGEWMVSLSNFGIQTSVVGQSELDVPAGSPADLYYAEPVESPTTTQGASAETSVPGTTTVPDATPQPSEEQGVDQ
ncbi:membrane protein [Paraoerskovia sediminicola]|uniref:Membrane protein n=1 Tax=Paraoerskovia sediminicola TaxID=1138587 RepID=A0ABN6XFM5_9CELL|nr:DUF881 domain-containing protein [Paraoerskovia sediminicola]BDZ43646.1 membrane protein [Paraoerskovia sediminicola]